MLHSSTDTKKNPASKAKFAKEKEKKLFLGGDFTPFISKSFQIWPISFHYLFPKDSENIKSLDIGLWEAVAKRCVNGVNE